MAKVNIAALLDAGTHFGHQTRRWNPKMKPYIFGSRGDIYIIDLKQTLYGLDKAYTFVTDLARKGGTILFVGTKKQAQEAVSTAANRCGMPYVNARWLGGMLTNFVTIRARVTRMEELEAMEADGRMAVLPKKEQILLRKELAKLQTNLNGVRNMKRTPDAVFVIDTNREMIAIHEARRLDLPVVGTLDTNCDPDDVEYGIPANDDAIRSVALLADFIADAVVDGAGAPVSVEEMSASAPQAEEAVKPVPAAQTTAVDLKAASAPAKTEEKAPAVEETVSSETVEKKAPAAKKAPAKKAEDKAPAVKKAPAKKAEKKPVEEKAAEKEEAPASEEKAAEKKEAPASEEKAAE